MVLSRQDPNLERRLWSIGSQDHEPVSLTNDTLLRHGLLTDDVAVHAAAFVLVVLATFPEFPPHVIEDDRNGGEPGVRVKDPGSGSAVPARDEQIANVDVSFEIPDPLRIHPEHLLPLRV